MALDNIEIQEEVLKLIDNGDTFLNAIEMLSYVNLRSWAFELTKDLCNMLNTFAKKRTELLVCHSPLLLCALTAELLMRLA